MTVEQFIQNYPLVQERYVEAYLSQKGHLPDLSEEYFRYIDNITWDRTVEGEDFWHLIGQRKFEEAKKKKPNLFASVFKRGIKTTTNGLLNV